MKHTWITFVLLFGLLIAGCSAVSQSAQSNSQSTSNPSDDLTRTDEQGAVVIAVEPLNLKSVDQTLDFEVSLNTHSVDLSMDLAGLATLTTDTGVTTPAEIWDAPREGHHVSGKLSFPASVNGTALLRDATELTLTIRDVDVPERIFKWELPK
ncbi:MAG: hypothetical protein LCI00_08530 [Chloroflexi bacterium]|nr:hypothetical protein [Chloroflexota bacterium]